MSLNCIRTLEHKLVYWTGIILEMYLTFSMYPTATKTPLSS